MTSNDVSIDLVRQMFRQMQTRTEEVKEVCTHTKTYRPIKGLVDNDPPKTAVVGSSLWSGDQVFVCQRCFKEWNSESMPKELMPPTDRIGKPLGIE